MNAIDCGEKTLVQEKTPTKLIVRVIGSYLI